MRLDSSIRRRLRLQNGLFLLLFATLIGLLAWLSTRYPMQADWTAGARNTLSEPSRILLGQLQGPLHITAYARENPDLREAISRLVERYRRYKPDLTLTFINPDLLPEQVRELGITMDGELSVDYRGRRDKVRQLSEQALSLALQRVGQPRSRTLLFLEGHGERKPLGEANYDLGTFGQELAKIGVQVRSISGLTEQTVSTSNSTLVIAGPQHALSQPEVQFLVDYVARGGNLLWLLDPGELAGLQPLAEALGITLLPGVVVDASTSQFGVKNPAFIPIADYGPHPITETLRAPALLPQVLAFTIQPPAGWTATVLLESQSRSWTETGPIEGSIQFDAQTTEQSGPLTVGIALARPRPPPDPSGESPATTPQRIVVIGDGDFLSNTYLGNGANQELGLNIVNWLTLDDKPLLIYPKAAPDAQLNLSDQTLAWLAAFFLMGLPISLLLAGWVIGFRRRRR